MCVSLGMSLRSLTAPKVLRFKGLSEERRVTFTQQSCIIQSVASLMLIARSGISLLDSGNIG